MIDKDEYAVRLTDLPTDVGGFITESPDGFTNIYINARHGRNGQRKSLCHELRHAEHDDLHNDEPLDVIEARADGADPQLKAIPKLVKARDLVPEKPQPKPQPKPLTHHQQAVLRNALSDLDRLWFNDDYYNF